MENTGVFYDAVMKPLNGRSLTDIRAQVVRRAHGSVLEIGCGTGENLQHYDLSRLGELYATDVDLYADAIRVKWRKIGAGSGVPLILREIDVQDLPFEDNRFDSVVFSLVFCSVSDPRKGLAEVYRVLKPEGRILFVEHVVSPNPFLASLMRHVTPAWRRWADNCHLDRSTTRTIAAAGFIIEDLTERAGGIFVAGVGRKPRISDRREVEYAGFGNVSKT